MRQHLTLIIALILTLTIGAYKISQDRDFWFDESYTLQASQQSTEHILTPNDVHPPLYYLTIKTLQLTTRQEIRAYSLTLALLTLTAIYTYTRRWHNQKTANYAALITATSSTFLYYATEARMYAMLALTTIIGLHYLNKTL